MPKDKQTKRQQAKQGDKQKSKKQRANNKNKKTKAIIKKQKTKQLGIAQVQKDHLTKCLLNYSSMALSFQKQKLC